MGRQVPGWGPGVGWLSYIMYGRRGARAWVVGGGPDLLHAEPAASAAGPPSA